jgi:hypothetical protein
MIYNSKKKKFNIKSKLFQNTKDEDNEGNIGNKMN